MYITVVGGGNSTPIFAVLSKLAGHTVAVLTRKPSLWSKNLELSFINEDPTYLNGQEKISAVVDLITDDANLCIPKSDMIFIAGIPIHFNREVLTLKIKPYLDVNKEVFIGTICAYGGFNWIAADVLGKGNYVIFGTQQIPWTCGTVKYGETGIVFGQKNHMRVATEDGKDKHNLKKILNDILHLPYVYDSDFLVSTLWPNNPSVHPPILYALFKDYDPKSGKKYLFGSEEAPEYIYKDLSREAAENIKILNDEQVAIVHALSKIPPHDKNKLLKDPGFEYMNSLIFAYGEDGVKDKSSIYAAIRTTAAYAKHKNPYVFVDEEKKYVVPNLEHKFFTTDLPYGLCTYKDIAMMVNVETKLIDAIIYWNQKLIGKEYLVDGKFTGKDCEECILPSKFGLTVETLHLGRRE